MHVESKKMIQMNLFPSSNRDADIVNRYVDTVEEGDGGTDW